MDDALRVLTAAAARHRVRAGPRQSLQEPLGTGGENLLAGIDLARLGLRLRQRAAGDHALHVVLAKD